MMFKLNKKLNFYFLFFVILLIAGGLSVYSALKIPDAKKIGSQPEPQVAVKAEEKKFINRQGQEWGPLPSGDYRFMVSSGKDAIVKFIQGEIDPPDVHVGDLQKFKIIVTSPNGITGVVAKIETDNGIKEVELKKTGVLAQADLSVNPIFTEDGINYDVMSKERFAASAKLQKERHIINTVDASIGENEVFEGNWTVVDTHNISYNTTFIATDKAGKTNQLVLAWSDLCGFTNGGSNYTLQMNCTISASQADGVDNGNLVIGTGYTLQIASGGTLAFNPGKSFSFVGTGAITIPATQPLGQITKKYIYIEDGDQDGYAPAASRLTFSNTNSTGYVSESGYNAKRRYTITSGADCYDSNANAKPGQTTYFTTQRGDGSFDYNCDASATPDPVIRKCQTAGQEAGWNYADGNSNSSLPGNEMPCQNDSDCAGFTSTNDFCITGYCCFNDYNQSGCLLENTALLTGADCGWTAGGTTRGDAYHVFSDDQCAYYGDLPVFDLGSYVSCR